VEWLSSASYNNAPTDLTFHAPSPDGCALAAVLAAFWGVRNGQGSSGLAAGLAAAVDQVNREPAAAASPVIGALASGLALALAGEAAVTLPDADVLFGLGGRSAHGARAFLATAERSVERIAAALTAGGGRAGGPAGAAGVWAPRDVGAAARAYGCALSGAEAEALHGALVAAARRERTDTASLALPGGFLLAEDARLAPVAFLAAWAGAETHRCCAVALRCGFVVGAALAAQPSPAPPFAAAAATSVLALVQMALAHRSPPLLRLHRQFAGRGAAAHVAAAAADTYALAVALAAGGSSAASAVDRWGRTLLHAAMLPLPGGTCGAATQAVCAQLLSRGVAVNARDQTRLGRSALHCLAALPADAAAIDSELYQLTVFLLAAGADAAAPDGDGFTPLQVACRTGPHAAPVAHAILAHAFSADAESNSALGEGMGGSSAAAESAVAGAVLARARTPAGETALTLALQPGGMLWCTDGQRPASRHVFPAAVRLVAAFAGVEARLSSLTGACPRPFQDGGGLTGAERDAVLQTEVRRGTAACDTAQALKL
jgi:hypothetical protein